MSAGTVTFWKDHLDQGELWKPNGRPMVRVADMDPEWRYNASRWLERNATTIADKYSLAVAIWFAATMVSPLGPSDASADGIEREIEDGEAARTADPAGWIRTTALHRALTADLPDGNELVALTERARHYSTCPKRIDAGPDCLCQVIAAQCDRCRSGDLCPLCRGAGCGAPCAECTPGVPEWTLS